MAGRARRAALRDHQKLPAAIEAEQRDRSDSIASARLAATRARWPSADGGLTTSYTGLRLNILFKV
jgi:hypothetical protein